MQRHDNAILRCVTYERAERSGGGASCACVCIGKIKRNQLGATTVKSNLDAKVGELTKCFLRAPIFGRSGSNHELFSQSFWHLPFVMFSGKRQMSYETVRTKSALVKFISFVLRALPRIMPSEST